MADDARDPLGKYVLTNDGVPRRVTDLLEWARWMETHHESRVLVQDRIATPGEEEPVLVSTVFLGLDHNFLLTGPPILWETMVFGGRYDGEQRRYASHEAALRGHRVYRWMVAREARRLARMKGRSDGVES